jgi:hypothetical protein
MVSQDRFSFGDFMLLYFYRTPISPDSSKDRIKNWRLFSDFPFLFFFVFVFFFYFSPRMSFLCGERLASKLVFIGRRAMNCFFGRKATSETPNEQWNPGKRMDYLTRPGFLLD